MSLTKRVIAFFLAVSLLPVPLPATLPAGWKAPKSSAGKSIQFLEQAVSAGDTQFIASLDRVGKQQVFKRWPTIIRGITSAGIFSRVEDIVMLVGEWRPDGAVRTNALVEELRRALMAVRSTAVWAIHHGSYFVNVALFGKTDAMALILRDPRLRQKKYLLILGDTPALDFLSNVALADKNRFPLPVGQVLVRSAVTPEAPDLPNLSTVGPGVPAMTDFLVKLARAALQNEDVSALLRARGLPFPSDIQFLAAKDIAVITDIDGTLLNREDTLTEPLETQVRRDKMRDALLDLMAAGMDWRFLSGKAVDEATAGRKNTDFERFMEPLRDGMRERDIPWERMEYYGTQGMQRTYVRNDGALVKQRTEIAETVKPFSPDEVSQARAIIESTIPKHVAAGSTERTAGTAHSQIAAVPTTAIGSLTSASASIERNIFWPVLSQEKREIALERIHGVQVVFPAIFNEFQPQYRDRLRAAYIYGSYGLRKSPNDLDILAIVEGPVPNDMAFVQIYFHVLPDALQPFILARTIHLVVISQDALKMPQHASLLQPVACEGFLLAGTDKLTVPSSVELISLAKSIGDRPLRRLKGSHLALAIVAAQHGAGLFSDVSPQEIDTYLESGDLSSVSEAVNSRILALLTEIQHFDSPRYPLLGSTKPGIPARAVDAETRAAWRRIADFLIVNDPLPAQAEAMIVFGHDLLDIPRAAAELAKQLGVLLVVPSGGKGRLTSPGVESEGREFANIIQEISRFLIVQPETASRTTQENVEFSMKIIQKSLRLVTSVVCLQIPLLSLRAKKTLVRFLEKSDLDKNQWPAIFFTPGFDTDLDQPHSGWPAALWAQRLLFEAMSEMAGMLGYQDPDRDVVARTPIDKSLLEDALILGRHLLQDPSIPEDGILQISDRMAQIESFLTHPPAWSPVVSATTDEPANASYDDPTLFDELGVARTHQGQMLARSHYRRAYEEFVEAYHQISAPENAPGKILGIGGSVAWGGVRWGLYPANFTYESAKAMSEESFRGYRDWPSDLDVVVDRDPDEVSESIQAISMRIFERLRVIVNVGKYLDENGRPPRSLQQIFPAATRSVQGARASS